MKDIRDINVDALKLFSLIQTKAKEKENIKDENVLNELIDYHAKKLGLSESKEGQE